MLSKAYKLAGTRKRIPTDLPVVMKMERVGWQRNPSESDRMRGCKQGSMIKEYGVSMRLEVRKDSADIWMKRAVSID